MKPLCILPAAETELGDAPVFYEERREGLGSEFLAAVDEALDRIAVMPDTFPRWHPEREYQCLRLERFPFVSFYLDLQDSVEVVAIAHAKRRPGYWTKR